jgi:predicted ATPase
MLIAVDISNYWSIHHTVVLALGTADDGHVGGITVLYGANASGKTSIVRSLLAMRTLVVDSVTDMTLCKRIGDRYFRLATTTATQPITFAAVFQIDHVRYRYQFAVDHRTSTIGNERLTVIDGHREETLFDRHGQRISVDRRLFAEGKGHEGHTRPDALFLSVVAAFGDSVARRITRWFDNIDIHTEATIDGVGKVRRMVEQRNLSELHPLCIEVMRCLDLGTEIDRIGSSPSDAAMLSGGTRRLLRLVPSIVRVLTTGGILVVDDIDLQLHPNLLAALIGIFKHRDINPHRAQLVATMHHAGLLPMLQRNGVAIRFVERSADGSTTLRNGDILGDCNDRLVDHYLAGHYGAVPKLGDIRSCLWDHAPGTSGYGTDSVSD